MKKKIPRPSQQNLFSVPAHNSHRSKFIATYRVTLIETHGQSDREQFCVLMLNAKNEIIGLNIVSTGDVSSATVTPRELLKPGILTNSSIIK